MWGGRGFSRLPSPFPSEGKQGDAEGEAGDGGRYYHQPEAVEIKPDPLVDSLLYSLTQTPAGDYDGPVPSSPEYRGPTSPLRTNAKGWRPDSPPKRAAAPVPVALAVLRMDQTQTASDGAGIKLLEPPTPLLFDSDATFGFAMRRVLDAVGLAFMDAHQIEGVSVRCYNGLRDEWILLRSHLEWNQVGWRVWGGG